MTKSTIEFWHAGCAYRVFLTQDWVKFHKRNVDGSWSELFGPCLALLEAALRTAMRGRLRDIEKGTPAPNRIRGLFRMIGLSSCQVTFADGRRHYRVRLLPLARKPLVFETREQATSGEPMWVKVKSPGERLYKAALTSVMRGEAKPAALG